MEFTAKSIHYPSGCMGTMVSGRMLKDRCDVHNDKSLGWLRGLISQLSSLGSKISCKLACLRGVSVPMKALLLPIISMASDIQMVLTIP